MGDISTENFFDRYPRFYSSSRVGSSSNRLNRRYRALIEANDSLIRGQRVLDLASHDGRWTLAALATAAIHVTGIEPRLRLTSEAVAAMVDYGIPAHRYTFMTEDVHEVLPRLSVGKFDTVFCFGFLYHTMHHMQLLSAIARLRPSNLIIDTNVACDERAVIHLEEDDPNSEASAYAGTDTAGDRVVVGIPSRAALEMMLKNVGYDRIRYFDWHGQGIDDWRHLELYRDGRRVSLSVGKRR